MMMSYLGSFKSFFYLPIFEIFGANVWSIRLPMVLVGAVTIFVFYKLLQESLGTRAALLGVFLLATDPLFLMTNTFDWGPVALEHVLLVTGCWALYRFGTQDGKKWLATGCFLFGVAFWNKAIFVWALAGLSAATVVALWPYFRARLTVANLRVAAAAFLVGAAPLVYYNATNSLATLTQNAHLVPQEIPGKWVQLEAGLQGNSLFGYVVSEEWMEPAKRPTGMVEIASVALRDAVGPRRNTGFYWVLGGLLVLVPLWWRSRAAWFALVFVGVAWVWMAMTHDAGASGHHVVLLWPFPIIFIAAALRNIPGKVLLPVGVLLAGSNLLVDNQYLAQLVRNGSHETFTDAVFPLSEALDEGAGNTIYVIDWGMFDALNLLHQGRLGLRNGMGALATPDPTPEGLADIDAMLHDPKGLFLDHVSGKEAFAGVGERLAARAEAAGLRLERVRQIADSNGRPEFDILRVAAGN